MFNLGNIKVAGDVFLAPMASFTDSPYRLICRRMGSGFSFAEFVSSEAVVRNNEKTMRMLRFVEEERPIVLQLFGNDPDVILEAARRMEQFQPDAIDLNMGCSVKKISLNGAGAGLLQDLPRIERAITLLVNNLKIPITAKIRLGWDHKSRNYLEVARLLEGAGISMISVHGRTRSDGYGGRADWDAIGELKSAVGVPVLGNGDVRTYAEALQKKVDYGVNGVLIGRAAIGNPWIFSGQNRSDVSLYELMRVVQEHLTAMLEFYERGFLLFRKHVARYFTGFPGSRQLRNQLVTAPDLDSFTRICRQFCDGG